MKYGKNQQVEQQNPLVKQWREQNKTYGDLFNFVGNLITGELNGYMIGLRKLGGEDGVIIFQSAQGMAQLISRYLNTFYQVSLDFVKPEETETTIEEAKEVEENKE